MSCRWRARRGLGDLEAGVLASLTSLRFSVVSGGPLWIACAVSALALPGVPHYDSREPMNLRRSAHEVAPELIGAELLVDGVGGLIVEVEATTTRIRPSARLRQPRTERNASMFLAGGHADVYRSYGVHWCLNFVCGEPGVASAVLIRALQPTRGLEAMRPARRHDVRLCARSGAALSGARRHGGARRAALDGRRSA